MATGRVFLLFLCALVGLGCEPLNRPAESPLRYTENAKKAYEAALVPYFAKDWEYAAQLLQDVKRKYGYSRYARLAELRLADADFHQEKYAEAVGRYKSFISDYPNDPEVAYARYKIARSQFSQSGASLLLPPLEERDLTNVQEAYDATRSYLSDYPNSKHTPEMEYMLQVVTGLLARHELYVARFYLNKDNFKAAVSRAQFALKNFADSGLEPEALVLLGETYLKMKETDKARATFKLVLSEYGTSPFSVAAKNFLARIEASHIPAKPLSGGGG